MKPKRGLTPIEAVEARLAKVLVHRMNPNNGRAACGIRVRKGPFRTTRRPGDVTCRRPGCRSTQPVAHKGRQK